MKNNIPTDVYEYEEAVEKDHVLVPFYLIETSTQISDDGITYADLDEEEREAYEAEFVEDGGVPEHIPPERINKYIFNVDTVDRMISDLMNNGIRHKRKSCREDNYFLHKINCMQNLLLIDLMNYIRNIKVIFASWWFVMSHMQDKILRILKKRMTIRLLR